MGGLCGGSKTPVYGMSPYGPGYGVAPKTGCCGGSGAQAYPYGYPQYVQPMQTGLVTSQVALPVTEVIETSYAQPIISGPAWQQNNLGPGHMISGPMIAGPPISIPTPHTINVGPPMGVGIGGPIGGGFGGPIGGGFGRTSIIAGGPGIIGGPMMGSPIGGGFRPGFPGGIGLPGAGIGLPGAIRY